MERFVGIDKMAIKLVLKDVVRIFFILLTIAIVNINLNHVAVPFAELMNYEGSYS